MLKPYDPFDQWSRWEDGIQTELQYTSGLISEKLGLNEESVAEAVQRAIRACTMMEIPVKENFRCRFNAEGENLHLSWDLSPFACYLTLVNCNPSNPAVAEAQVYFARSNANQNAEDFHQ